MNTPDVNELARKIARDLIAGKLLFGFSSEPTLTQLIVFHIEPLVKERDDARAELAATQKQVVQADQAFNDAHTLKEMAVTDLRQLRAENERLREALQECVDSMGGMCMCESTAECSYCSARSLARAALATTEGKAPGPS